MPKLFVADFETTVNTEKTEVWSAASIALDADCTPDNVKIQTSIEDYFKHVFSFSENCIIYFHNDLIKIYLYHCIIFFLQSKKNSGICLSFLFFICIFFRFS